MHEARERLKVETELWQAHNQGQMLQTCDKPHNYFSQPTTREYSQLTSYTKILYSEKQFTMQPLYFLQPRGMQPLQRSADDATQFIPFTPGNGNISITSSGSLENWWTEENSDHHQGGCEAGFDSDEGWCAQ